MCIPGEEEWYFSHRRPRQVDLCFVPGYHKMLEESFFQHSCVSCIRLASSSKLKTISHILLPSAIVRKRYQELYFSGCKLDNILLSIEKIGSSLFLPLSSRMNDTNLSLLRKYWADLQYEFVLEQEFCVHRISIEVYTRWSVSVNRCNVFVGGANSTVLFERKKNFHATSLPTLTQECPMSFRKLHLVILDFLGSRNTILTILFPLNVDMNMFGPWTLRAGCSFSPSRYGIREEEIMTKILGIFLLEIDSPSIPTALWYDEYNLSLSTWPFHLLSMLLDCLSPFQHRTESEKTFALAHLIDWSWDNTDLVHEGDEHCKDFSFRISSECSITNCWVILNKLSISSNFVFLQISEFVKEFGSRWKAAFIDEAKNNSNVNTMVLYACIDNVRRLMTFPISSPKLSRFSLWQILSMYWWFMYICSEFLSLTHTEQFSLCYWSMTVVSHYCVFGVESSRQLFPAATGILWCRLAWEYPISDLEANRMLFPRCYFDFFHRYSLDWPQIPNFLLAFAIGEPSLEVVSSDTCLIVGLRPLIIILITASFSSQVYNWDSLWEQSVNFLFSSDMLGLGFGIKNCPSFLLAKMFGLGIVFGWT